MLTSVREYLRLPLDKHPLSCAECDDSLLEGRGVVVWKLASTGEDIVLCCKCAEQVGFALWTDSLRPEG